MTPRPFAVVNAGTGRVLSRHATEALAAAALVARQRSVTRRLNFGGSQAGVSADRFAPLGIMDLRAGAARAEGKRRAAILRAIDLDGDTCECGQLVDEHTPLPKPGPLMARVQPVMGRPPRPGAFGINR